MLMMYDSVEEYVNNLHLGLTASACSVPFIYLNTPGTLFKRAD